jgi:hypothetical protein
MYVNSNHKKYYGMHSQQLLPDTRSACCGKKCVHAAYHLMQQRRQHHSFTVVTSNSMQTAVHLAINSIIVRLAIVYVQYL